MCSACCCSTSSSLPACSALALALVYLTQPPAAARRARSVPWYDWILAALSLVVGGYIAVAFRPLSEEVTSRPLDGLIVAFIVIPLVIEALRRVAGAAAGDRHHLLPGLRAGRPPGAGPARRPPGQAHAARLLSRLGPGQHARPADGGGDHHRHRLHLLRPAPVRLRRIGVLHRHLARADGPLSRRLRQDRGHRLLAVRHDLGQRGEQRRLGRRHHHSADAAGRLSGAHRRRDRGGRLDRRPIDAAGDGRRRLPDGGVPAGPLPRRGDRRAHCRRCSITSRCSSRPTSWPRRVGITRVEESQIPADRRRAQARLAFPAAVRRADRRAVLVQLVA